jgi:type VI secretion system protein ImpH
LAVIPTPDTTPEAQREADRAAEAAFLARLAEEPWAHDFFAAVRRAEAVRSDVPGVGRSSRADEDPFRFAQEPSLAFSPCNLSEFKAATGTAPARLFVSFMGLLGPNGPMPLHVTDYARERQIHHKDHTLARFLDVFNHRMVSLFYRAWAASQMTVSFDRWEPGASTALDSVTRELALARDTDRYATYIGSLFGLGMDSLRHRDGVQDLAKLHFSGRLSNQVKNPEGVRSILRDYLGVDVEIEEFLGRWTDVPPEYHMSLGRMPPAGRGAGCIGATGGVMGTRVFDCGSAFRLRLGPMSLEHYQRMLPGTRTARRIDAWIRTYLGDEFWWEAVLILRRDEVPKARLGAGTRLGWTSWIHSGAAEEDRADLALRSPR